VVRALAIDVGSSSVRTAQVDEHGTVSHVQRARLTVRSPSPGEVELDAAEIAHLALDLARRTLADGGPCAVVGVTNQRATTIVFDPVTYEAVGPALSWQDLRTVLDCLVLQGQGLRLAPNQSATKARWLVDHARRPAAGLRFATVETWIAWHLSEGASFVTDRSNASVNGLAGPDLQHWDENTLSILGLDPTMLPRLVDTAGELGTASALDGAPAITALMGDQPASLFGQSCVRHGAKITFGTGAMLDLVGDRPTPTSMRRLASGCYPTVVRSLEGSPTWGLEGIVLSAGSCVEWLTDLGLIATSASSEPLARSVPSSDGVTFVPAFSGLGTPQWDFGARGAFFGLTRGSSRAHLVRAVLEGVAQRGVDLLLAAEEETGSAVEEIRVDGGMTGNRFFVQRLADFTGRPVAVSSEREATARGVGLMALVGAGFLGLDDVTGLWSPAYVATPAIGDDERDAARRVWRDALTRAERTIPELSTVAF
jgi:glycerol kinase